MKTYYYEEAGQQAGPLSADDLRAHRVQATTLVWCEGMTDWAPAASLVELAAFFQPIPPPLPKRLGPPPLPSPKSSEVGTTATISVVTPSLPDPATAFVPSGYSVPQLGVFRDDTAIYALDSGKLVASFEKNVDLDRVYKDGLWFNEAYRFVLLDTVGKLLLTFYKPAKGLMQSLKHELHILDAQDQLLGICRNKMLSSANPDSKQDGIITVTDAYSQTLFELNSMNKVVELVQRNKVPGYILGSKGIGEVDQAPLVYMHDRFELHFNPEASVATKSIGLGALLALHLFVRHRWRA